MQSDAISGAQDSANAAQAQGRDQARADLEPWRTAGAGALMPLNALLGINGSDPAATTETLRNLPGYEFARTEGLRAVDTGAAARGLLRSGSTLRAEQQFGQGLADQTFGQHYDRLLRLATLGQNAATGSASASLKTGEGIAQTDASAGSQQARIIGNTNTAVQNGIGSIYGQRNALFGDGTLTASAGLTTPNPLMGGANLYGNSGGF